LLKNKVERLEKQIRTTEKPEIHIFCSNLFKYENQAKSEEEMRQIVAQSYGCKDFDELERFYEVRIFNFQVRKVSRDEEGNIVTEDPGDGSIYFMYYMV